MRLEKAITVGAVGVTTTTSATSAGAAIPNNLAGAKPRYIRVAAINESFIRLGVGGVPTATNNDLLIQPADALILAVGGNTHFAVIQGAAAGRVNVVPLEDE